MRNRICLWLLALSLLLGGCAAPSAGGVLRQSAATPAIGSLFEKKQETAAAAEPEAEAGPYVAPPM